MERKNVAYVLPIIHTWDFLNCEIMTPLKNNKSYVLKGFGHAITLIGALQQCEEQIEYYIEIKWSNKQTI